MSGHRCALCALGLEARPVPRLVRSSHQRSGNHGEALPRERITRAVVMKPVQAVFGVGRFEGSWIPGSDLNGRPWDPFTAHGLRLRLGEQLRAAHVRLCVSCLLRIEDRLRRAGFTSDRPFDSPAKLSDVLRVLADEFEERGS